MIDLPALIELLGLEPHPEGGWYRETFRSTVAVDGPTGRRDASTAIWFALPHGGFSAFHRVAADEVWHWYDGAPLRLHILTAEGLRTATLGRDWSAGQRPQHVVPAGAWQAAEAPDGAALCGCTVAPGFTFADFALDDGSLAQRFPAHADLVRRLAR